MQITSKGQVTIPQNVRNQLGLLPHTEVEFEGPAIMLASANWIARAVNVQQQTAHWKHFEARLMLG